MTHPFLLLGALFSAIAALLHLACIAFGAPWYRFFGAGEGMARLAEAGSPKPAIITMGIAAVLAAWSLYALSGAGVIGRLPLARWVLCAISAVYLLRGLAGLVLAVFAPGERSVAFWWWSSAICLAIGAVYLMGTRQAWPRLSGISIS